MAFLHRNENSATSSANFSSSSQCSLDGRTVIRDLDISPTVVDQVAEREQVELDRRSTAFRGSRQPPAVADRVVILVDDGLATGATMEAAILALRKLKPARIVVAVPVGAAETCARIGTLADEVVAVSIPREFHAVGMWYDDFDQTSDAEVVAMLAQLERIGT